MFIRNPESLPVLSVQAENAFLTVNPTAITLGNIANDLTIYGYGLNPEKITKVSISQGSSSPVVKQEKSISTDIVGSFSLIFTEAELLTFDNNENLIINTSQDNPVLNLPEIIIPFENSTSVIPNAPTNVAVTQENQILVLTWDSVFNASKYNIYRDNEYITTVIGTQFNDSGLIESQSYDYYVVSVNDTETLFSVASSTVTIVLNAASNTIALVPPSNINFNQWSANKWSEYMGLDLRYSTAAGYPFISSSFINGTPSIKYCLEPSEIGSERLNADGKLPPALAYRVKFTVLFENGFDFGGHTGGNLRAIGKFGLGLGGGDSPVGGSVSQQDGFRERFMWRGFSDGTIYDHLYSYRADTNIAEINAAGDNFSITTNIEIDYELEVRLNSDHNSSNGVLAWKRNNIEVFRKSDVKFLGAGTLSIDRLVAETFYGGNDSSYSPAPGSKNYLHIFNASYEQLSVTPVLTVPGLKVYGQVGDIINGTTVQLEFDPGSMIPETDFINWTVKVSNISAEDREICYPGHLSTGELVIDVGVAGARNGVDNLPASATGPYQYDQPLPADGSNLYIRVQYKIPSGQWITTDYVIKNNA